MELRSHSPHEGWFGKKNESVPSFDSCFDLNREINLIRWWRLSSDDRRYLDAHLLPLRRPGREPKFEGVQRVFRDGDGLIVCHR